MKPIVSVITHVNIHKRYIKSRGLQFFSHPYYRSARAPLSYPLPACLLILLLSSGHSAQTTTQGTAIVTVVTASEIGIAADSAISDGAGKIKDRTFCKIQKSGGVYFACAHLYAYTSTKFDAYVLITDVLKAKTGSSFADKVAAVEVALRGPLLETLKHMYTWNRSSFDRLTKDEIVAAYEIFGWEDNAPILAMRNFAAKRNAITGEPESIELKEKRMDCPGCPNPILGIMGKRAVVDNLAKQVNPLRLFGELRPHEIARFFVSVAAIAEEGVGTPIDVMRINKDGACWVECKSGCDAGMARCQDAKAIKKPTKPRRKRRVHKSS